MKLKKLILENFKAYEKAEIDFNDITIIVGRNDSGKSTILQALNLFFNPKEANTKDIFFNDGQKTAEEILIECHFKIGSNPIMLGDEDNAINIIDTNLLTEEGDFVIGYKFNAQNNVTHFESHIQCYNYDLTQYKWSKGKKILELMDKSELDSAIKELEIVLPKAVDDRENDSKRKALEQYVVKAGLTKSSHKIVLQAKNNRLSSVIAQFPKFRLFSNDNANSIDDKEHSMMIENEIKTIVAEQMKSKINEINLAMQQGMQTTLSKINQIFKELFGFLGDDNFTLQDGSPKITFSKNGIVDKKGLSIENRGSGFRRLALLSLHLSTYEEDAYKNMILAIEEPETSQNPANQKGIILAIQKLIAQGARVIVTTHSPAIAKEFGYENVEYNIIENDGIRSKKLDYNGGEAFDQIIDY